MSDEDLRQLEREAVAGDDRTRSRYRVEAARHGDLRPLRRDLVALVDPRLGIEAAEIIGGFEVCLKDNMTEVPGLLAFSWVHCKLPPHGNAVSERGLISLVVEDDGEVTLGVAEAIYRPHTRRSYWIPIWAWPDLAPWSLRPRGETASLDGYGFGMPASFAYARIHATPSLARRLKWWAKQERRDRIRVLKDHAYELWRKRVSHVSLERGVGWGMKWILDPGSI